MALTPYDSGPEDWRALIRGEMARRGQPIPGQAAPSPSMAPVEPAGPPMPTPAPQPSAAPAAAPVQLPGASLDGKPQASAGGATGAAPKAREPGWIETIFGTINNGGGYFDARKEAMRKEALRDPSSPESASMRQRMGPMLAQLGLRGDEIGALSGEDISAVASKGDLLSGVMNARAKAAQAKAQAAATAQAKADQRKYDAAEFDRRNAITAPQLDKRAETMAGLTADRMVGGALLGARIQAGAAATADDRKQAAEQRAEQNRIEAEARGEERKKADEARKIADETSKAHLAEEAALDEMEKKLKALPPDSMLPGQEPPVVQAAYKAKQFFTGGTGRGTEPSQLQRDMTNLGAATLHATRGTLTENDMKDAAGLYAGDGSVAGALGAVKARRAVIAAEKRKAEAAKSKSSARVPVAAPTGEDWEPAP